jgi:transposase
VRVGMEATGYARWFERLLAELGFELWIGDPAQIKAKRVKKQKYDREDARLLRRLMLENNFPQIWVPDPENRDLRQLLWHRHRLVQMRTRIMNQLQALAMNEGKFTPNISRVFTSQNRFSLLSLQFQSPIRDPRAASRNHSWHFGRDCLIARTEPCSVIRPPRGRSIDTST